jgi:hypothetical protein
MEENVRKLCLTLAAGIAVLSTGALPSYADGVLPGPGTGYRGAIEEPYGGLAIETPVVQQVGMVCTHFWNGRWHHRQICFWTPGHRHHHQHHHHHRHRFH